LSTDLLEDLKERGNEEAVLFYETPEGRIGIGADQELMGGKVSVYHYDEMEEEERENLVRGIWVEEDGEIGETESNTYEGTGREIKAQIQEWSCYTVKRIWRGLHPLGDDDFATGETLDVEYEKKPRTMQIHLDSEARKPCETLVRPLKELFNLFRAEYGWAQQRELMMLKEKKRLTSTTVLEGSSLVLRGIDGRIPMVRVIYPDERKFVKVPYVKGQEILNHIQEQVGAQVSLRVIEKGVLPCDEPFEARKDYRDAGLEMTLCSPLPKFQAIEHQDERFPNHRERCEKRLWDELTKRREEYVKEIFIEQTDDLAYRSFWKRVERCGQKAQNEWINVELKKLNPETIKPEEVMDQAKVVL
jgi:hypothetical protein